MPKKPKAGRASSGPPEAKEMMTVCFCLLGYLLLFRRGFVPGGFKTNSMKSISESLRVFATAAQQAAVVLAALVPIIEAIDRAEKRRKKMEVLILKAYTLGLTFNEAQRLKKCNEPRP